MQLFSKLRYLSGNILKTYSGNSIHNEAFNRTNPLRVRQTNYVNKLSTENWFRKVYALPS